MDYEIDVEDLRRDLLDYFGTAMSSGFPMASVDLAAVERASAQELVEIAQRAGVLHRYISISGEVHNHE